MKMIEKSNKYTHRDLLTLRFALEFRHPSWFSEDVYRILNRQKNISLCFADSPQWPCQEIIIGNLIYIRMHGGKTLYGSNYTEEKLITWVKKIKKWLRQNRDVYVYFNNDARGYAPKNAQKLKKMIAE
jgi:uncharacterized protein YecE (DUF72 family)